MMTLPPDDHGGQSQCHLLIVEDDMVQCGEMASFLGRSGLTVQMAYTGASALHQAAKYRPRVALLDFHLPDMTGVELAKELRALLPGIAFIMMSGEVEGLTDKTLQEIGIAVFVNKPVPLGPLRQAVLKLVLSPAAGRAAKSDEKSWFSTGLGGRRT